MSDCAYYKAATSSCLRTVQSVIHFVAEGERRFERVCKEHYAEIVARIQEAGHEIVEVSACCCKDEGCCVS